MLLNVDFECNMACLSPPFTLDYLITSDVYIHVGLNLLATARAKSIQHINGAGYKTYKM